MVLWIIQLAHDRQFTSVSGPFTTRARYLCGWEANNMLFLPAAPTPVPFTIGVDSLS